MSRREAAPRSARSSRRRRCIRAGEQPGNSSRSSSRSLKSRLASGSSSKTRIGILDERAGQRRALLLAAGQFAAAGGRASASAATARRRRPTRSLISAFARMPRDPQRRGDVLEHRHVRIVDELLVHHRDVALLRPETPVTSRRRTRSRRSVGRSSPAISCIRVVLPASGGAEQDVERAASSVSDPSGGCASRRRRASDVAQFERHAGRSTRRFALEMIGHRRKPGRRLSDLAATCRHPAGAADGG